MLVAICIIPILLIALAEVREFVQRRFALFTHFKTFDSPEGERTLLDAEIPQCFSNKEEMFRALLEVKVPGYGLSGNTLWQSDGSTIWPQSIEIPGGGKDRCLVFREVDGKFLKCDDFVYDPNHYTIADVRTSDGQLTYLGPTGQTVAVIRLEPKAPRASGPREGQTRPH
jgi:hypothetical protein